MVKLADFESVIVTLAFLISLIPFSEINLEIMVMIIFFRKLVQNFFSTDVQMLASFNFNSA